MTEPSAGSEEARPAQAPDPGFTSTGLVPVQAYQSQILAAIRALPPTRSDLADAEGCVLAEDVTAAVPLPSFDNSSMDGYAVLAADLKGASEHAPVTLPVTGEIAAGETGAFALVPGTAIRIMTGALMPAGADAVVPVELTDGGVARVAIRAEVCAGNSVRYAGGDAVQGETLLVRGTRLKPMHIAVAASAGRARVLVRPRPRVVVLATGNELAEPGTPLVPGRIWESNSYMIAAAVREAGAIAYRHAIVPDDPAGVLPTIGEQLLRADLLVTTGGVSMGGEHDVVKAALSKLGTVTFRKVAMQPGMPQGFGTIGDDRIPIFTLPGNPVSAYVSFQLFVRPAISALQDRPGEFLPMISATLTGPLRSPAGRRSFLRGDLSQDKTQVTPLRGQGSHQIAALGKATALIIVPEMVTTLGEGEKVDVLVLPLFSGGYTNPPGPLACAASVRNIRLRRPGPSLRSRARHGSPDRSKLRSLALAPPREQRGSQFSRVRGSRAARSCARRLAPPRENEVLLSLGTLAAQPSPCSR
jgi:molybdopterin molybdotransferase